MTLWTIVLHGTRKPVLPNDCNPDSDDEGMLCYRSREAAEKAAKWRSQLYGLACHACEVERAVLS